MIANFVTRIKQWLLVHAWDVALILLLGLTGLATGLWAREIILDDAAITYRVAENLAGGRGFVYNVGERVQVTTTPLYAIALALGTRLFGTAPRAALALNLVLAAVIPMLAYDMGRRLSGRITGISGALLLAFSPFLVMAFSMESYLYATLILATMEAYAMTRLRLAGTLAGFTAIVRGDGALLGAAMLIFDVIAHRRLRRPLIVPTVSIPAVWYLFAWWYYGSPFPATLSAKVAQGELNWLGQRFLDGLLSYWHVWTQDQGHAALYLIPVLIVLGLIPVVRTERVWLILVGHGALYLTAFVALGVPTAEWYYAPLIPGIAMMTARGIQFVADSFTYLLRKLPGRDWHSGASGQILRLVVAAGITAILLSALYPISSSIIQQNPNWKAQIYPDAARWIAANTNKSANLATIDIGHLGYWSGRPIIDIVGLAQPDVSPHIAEGDFGYAIRHYQPDMVVIGYSWIPEVQRTAWFQTNYVPRHYFKFPGRDEPLMLFSRREGVKVQPDSLPTNIQPLNVDFNQQITLTGYHVNHLLAPGSPLNLTLFWQAKAPLAVDFTVFVQLVDADNNVIAQKDSKPQNGHYGTPYWQPGEQIIDAHTFLIPLDTSPGRYDLLVGFYESASGHRLQILDETGKFVSDHVRLPAIEIQTP